MGFLIGLLTVVMVLDCVVPIFLVLIQLPKKDAGAGLAGATGARAGWGLWAETANTATPRTASERSAFPCPRPRAADRHEHNWPPMDTDEHRSWGEPHL